MACKTHTHPRPFPELIPCRGCQGMGAELGLAASRDLALMWQHGQKLAGLRILSFGRCQKNWSGFERKVMTSSFFPPCFFNVKKKF